jgi:hypothetical protein
MIVVMVLGTCWDSLKQQYSDFIISGCGRECCSA